MDKKVLIIAYYWPPSGGSGVQRWLKFVKYLPSFGWKPYVFTPENPSFDSKDESLLRDIPPEAEIIRFPIWEPYALFKSLSGKKNSGTFVPGAGETTFFQRLSLWVRGNLFIPDPRIFWVRPSVNFLSDYLIKNHINTVITTGPPHSIHLIGLKLKRKNPALKWIADFRDPWSEWGFLDTLKVGALARSIHRRLEKKVLTTADEVLTITPFYVRQLSDIGGRKVNLLTNGFDDSDFKDFELKRDDTFLIRHIGIVNEKCDPRPFLSAVRDLCKQDDEVKNKLIVEFVGSVHPSIKQFVLSDSTMTSFVRFTEAVPHRDLMNIYATSAVLVLILTGYKDAEGYMPGKLFEYMATGVPILGVGPTHGDAAALLNNSGAGVMIEGENGEAISQYLRKYFDNWKRGESLRNASESRFSRKQLTSDLALLLAEIKN
jgi:glycosyltransferase involved in cell wall biosynthesis